MAYYRGTDSLDTMIKIVESGGIKSKNKRQADYDTLYNGDDYISIGKIDEVSDYSSDSCFLGWIFGKPTFIISDDISAIKPEFRWDHSILIKIELVFLKMNIMLEMKYL